MSNSKFVAFLQRVYGAAWPCYVETFSPLLARIQPEADWFKSADMNLLMEKIRAAYRRGPKT